MINQFSDKCSLLHLWRNANCFFCFLLHIFAFFLGVLLLTHHPHWLFWSDFLLILYWCHVPLFLWFCCMCGRCSRYLGLNSFECLCVFSVFSVVTSSVCLHLVLFLVFVVFCLFVECELCLCLWKSLSTFSVCILCYVFAGTAWCTCEYVFVLEALFVCITLTCVCVQGQCHRFWTVLRRFMRWRTAARKTWTSSTVSFKISTSTPC